MSALKLFETDRLVLSGWRDDELDDLVRLHGDPLVARYLDADGQPWSREKAATRLALWHDNVARHRMGKLRLTRKSDGGFIGRAGYGIYPPTGEPELGYALFREHHGQGYAREAATALRDWIFRDTDASHFIGFADTRNAPSLAVLRKIGMVPTRVEAEPGGLLCQFHICERPPHHV